MRLVHIDSVTWIEDFSIFAHRLGFSEERPKDRDRVSGAFLIVDEEPLGYATYIEMADYWAYVQFGAAFPKKRKTPSAFIGMKMIMDELKNKYKLLTLCVENTNISALKCFLKLEFLIVGFRSIYGINYVELAWNNTK